MSLSLLDHAVRALARGIKEGDPAGTVSLLHPQAFLILRAMKQRHIKKRVRDKRIAKDAKALVAEQQATTPTPLVEPIHVIIP